MSMQITPCRFLVALVAMSLSLGLAGDRIAVAATLQDGENGVESTIEADEWQDAAAETLAARQEPAEATEDDRVRFSFANWEWKRVIEWYAEQANFNLQPIADPPQGTFTYISEESYTLTEAMDIINDHLFSRGYTLVRNRRTLKLAQINRDFPAELVEEISPDQLDARGRFEILRCRFDMTDLDISAMEREIRGLVNRNVGEVVPYYAANFIVVRDTGDRLRTIRFLINEARKIKEMQTQVTREFTLQHTTFAEMMELMRPLMNLNGNASADGNITIVPQLLSNKLFVRATQARMKEFEDALLLIDVPADLSSAGTLERPFLAQYTVRSDPTLAFKILQTMLVGRDVKVDLDEKISTIFVWGRTDDHKVVSEVVQMIETADGSFREFVLKNRTPAEAIAALQNMFGIDPADTSATRRTPIFYPDAIQNRLIVRGTPTDLAQTQSFLELLDRDDESLFGQGARPSTIRIDANERQMNRVEAYLQDMWPSTGRRNRIEFVMPEDRRNRSRPSLLPPLPPIEREDETGEGDGDESNDGEAGEATDQLGYHITPAASLNAWLSSGLALAGILTSGAPLPNATSGRQDQQDEVGNTSVERQDDRYTPAPQQPSVPGAPVTVKFTEYGIVVSSEDLDAVEDMKRLIDDLLFGTSTQALPQVYYLKYRGANEAKNMLDSLLGIGGGSGGGNMFGNLLGGAMGNVFGGGVGDMMGGLLGGGGSDTSGMGIELEGTVSTVADIRINALFVSGATENDLELIDAFVEFLDMAEAPHSPELLGQSYFIPVQYRDPVDLEAIIRSQMGPILRSTGGGDSQTQAMQQQMQMMQQLQQMFRGGGRGGGGQASEEERPKAAIGVDAVNRIIIVTGPRYIYEQILQIVEGLDRSPYDPSHRADVYRPQYSVPVRDLVGMLREVNPNLRIVEAGAGADPSSGLQNQGRQGGAGGQAGGQQGPGGGQAQQQINDAFRNAMQQMQRMQGGGQQGGGRGGGGRGGGGRGGRGG